MRIYGAENIVEIVKNFGTITFFVYSFINYFSGAYHGPQNYSKHWVYYSVQDSLQVTLSRVLSSHARELKMHLLEKLKKKREP